MTSYTYFESPVGPILLTTDGESLTQLYFRHDARDVANLIRDDNAAPFPKVKEQLTEYFAGTRTEFDLPISAIGTAFQRLVWNELTRIPYGATISYGELARRIGNPAASRAVGLANGQNPLSIVIPCHRVIGANGKLTGYGGGLSNKKWLLDLEAGRSNLFGLD